MGKNTSFTTRQVIIGASIIGCFLGMAFLTYKVGSENSENNNAENEEIVIENQINNNQTNQSASQSSPEGDIDEPLTKEEIEELFNDANIVKQQADVEETDPFEELDNMIGLESVKSEVISLANYVKLMRERENEGLKSPKVTYHCVFTGNPGTGKTTVARLLARIYKKLGVVSKGQLIETDRSGLIAQYTGQTAPKTNAIIDKAIGGILFIDEAYALNEGENDAYGQEAIATLLKRMEDDREDLVVIVAGYTNEMKKFIDTNPGLQSRFTRYIEFPDYTADELYRIFESRMKPYSIVMSTEAQKTLRESLEATVQKKSKNFGNGRYVRNLFETSLTNMANRLSKKKQHSVAELNTITKEDIDYAIKMVRK